MSLSQNRQNSLERLNRESRQAQLNFSNNLLTNPVNADLSTIQSNLGRFNRPITRCTFVRIEGGKVQPNPIVFNLNPSAFTRRLSVDYLRHISPGGSGGIAQFIKTSDQKITFDIFLSSFNRKAHAGKDSRLSDLDGILPDLAEYELLCRPQADLFISDNAQFIPPPTVQFTMGKRSWSGHIDELTIMEDEHNENMIPTRATISVTFTTDKFTFNGLLTEVVNLKNQARRGT